MKRFPLTVPGAAACLALALAGSAGSTAAASAPDSSGQDSAPQIGTLAGTEGAVPSGWYFIPLSGSGGGPYATSSPPPLRAIVHVPPGSTAHRHHVITGADGSQSAMELSVATWITRVDTEPCGGGRLVDPGPTVADLADALATYAATPSSEVTVNGYDGRYLEVDTPQDVSRCPGGIYRLMADRAERTAGTSRLWILDVEGFRVVATVNAPTGTADSDQAAGLAQSLLFVPTRAPH